MVNAAFTYAIQGDIPATAYDATGLPPGLTINPVTGTITGTPTTTGTYAVTLKASNSAGTGSDTLSLQVKSPSTQAVSLTLYAIPAVLVQGAPGQSCALQYAESVGSTTNWITATVMTRTNAAQFYVDLTATNAAKRFYRAVLQP